MKSGTPDKKRKVRLHVSGEIHFRLIGISSHENDYRLVWAINNQLSFQFTRLPNLGIHHLKLNTDLEFARYSYTDDDKYLTFNLISNRCPDGFLFPELKNFDFLFQIIGELSPEDQEELLKKLKSVEVISACFILNPFKIKDIRKILQE